MTKEERKNSYTSHTSLQRNPVADPGEGPREPAPPPPPPLFLDQTEARRAEKILLETGPPLFQGSGWPGPLLSQGLDPALIYFLHVRGLWFCQFYTSLLAPLCPLCLACIWSLLCVSCMRVILTLFVIAHDATVSLRHLVWMRISRRNLVSTNWLQYYLGFATPTGTWSKIAYHEIPLT